MASRYDHVDGRVLDGIESQLSGPSSKTTKSSKTRGTKSRAHDKSSRDTVGRIANTEGQTAPPMVQPTPSTSSMSTLQMAATTAPSEVAQLQLTVSALAEQMNWFMTRLAEDDTVINDEGEQAANSPTEDVDSVSIASTSTQPRQPEAVDVLTGLEAFYDASEQVAPDVDGQLANIVGNLCRTKLAEDKLKEKLSAYVRPGNCEQLTLPRVNPEIWEKLSPNTRSADIKLQRVQNANVQAMIAITHATDTLVAATKSGENFSKEKLTTTITTLVDGLALMANATQELNQRRREGQRTDLNVAYKGLCNNDTGMSRFLYGDDLPARIKEINETNRVGSKLAAGPTFGQRHSTLHRYGQRQQPYPARGKPNWMGRFRGAFLDRGSHHTQRGRPFPRRGHPARATARRGQRMDT